MPRRALLALLPILALAAFLRFTGLAWGLRHPPFSDERSFVESVGKMLSQGDLDHRFYEYPGLFFYALYPVVALVGPEHRDGPLAYLAARGVVAAFGVTSVALVYLLGSRLMGPRGGLVAALFLALSPVDVRSCHMVRPDVALGTFALAAFLAFTSVGPGMRGGDLASGLALGLAGAVKYTGVLLAPSYLVQRLLAPGPRVKRIALVAVVALLVFFAATPYALIHVHEFIGGARFQIEAHYRGRVGAPSYLKNVVFYGRTAVQILGRLGALLALVGIGLSLREWRRWLPLLVFPVSVVAVMSTAELRFARFLVPASGILALLAARAIEGVARRYALPAAALVFLAALASFGASASYVAKASRPGPRDRALDWIEAHVPPGSRVLNLCRNLRLGIDRRRHEVIDLRPRTAKLALLAMHMDLVIAYPDAARHLPGLRRVHHARADVGEGPFELLVPQASQRPDYQPWPVREAQLSASEDLELLPALLDHDLGTAWRTTGPRRGGEWVQVLLPEPTPVGRLELGLGTRPPGSACDPAVLVTKDGTDWELTLALSGRAPFEAQAGAPWLASQVLILPVTRIRGLRLLCTQRGKDPWEIAELRVDVRRRAPGS